MNYDSWKQLPVRPYPLCTFEPCRIKGSSEYNALGLYVGSNVTASDVLELQTDGVVREPTIAGGYLIVSDDLKKIPSEVIFFLKNAGTIEPYVYHYHNVDYDISINGREMNSLNMYDIPGLMSGKAYFEDTKEDNLWTNKPTLVLDGATLNWKNASDWNVPNAVLKLKPGKELTVKVLGDCVINAPDHTGLDLYGNTTITGGGTLRINSKLAAIETWDDVNFTLGSNTTLIAHSSDYVGYKDSGMDYYQSWFTIEGGGLFAAYGAIIPFKIHNDRLVHYDSYTDVRYPVGGTLGEEYIYDADGNEVTNDWAVIGWDTQRTDELLESVVYHSKKKIGLSINGNEMIVENIDRLPGVDRGTAYIELNEADEPTLVLDHATLDWNDASKAFELSPGKKLTIKVTDYNIIDATDHTGLCLYGNTTIEGGGTLRINSKASAIETFENARLTIRDNTKVIAHSSEFYGYYDNYDDYGAYCTIEDGAIFAAFGAGPYNPFSFAYRSALLGEGIELRYPANGYLSGMYVYDYEGTEVTNDWAVFGPDNQATRDLIYDEIYYPQRHLGFIINGKEMTALDMNDVPGVVSGRAHIFDLAPGDAARVGASIVLSLRDATLDWNDASNALHLRMGSDLLIFVEGDCTINAPDNTGLSISGNAIIDGFGTLRINSKGSAIEIFDNARLTIRGHSTVIAHSSDYFGYRDAGIEDGASCILESGAVFAAFGAEPYNPFYFGYGNLILGDDTSVCYPVGGWRSGRYVYDAEGNVVTDGWVVFGPEGQATQDFIDGVGSPIASPDSEGAMYYNLSGQRMNRPAKGINIVKQGSERANGKKVLVK